MADLMRIGMFMKKASWHFLNLENATSPTRNFHQKREGFRKLSVDAQVETR